MSFNPHNSVLVPGMPLRKIHPKAAKMENPEMLRKQMVALSQELNRVLEQLASLRDSSDAAIIGSLGTNVEALAQDYVDLIKRYREALLLGCAKPTTRRAFRNRKPGS
jgi:hypothetical protein